MRQSLRLQHTHAADLAGVVLAHEVGGGVLVAAEGAHGRSDGDPSLLRPAVQNHRSFQSRGGDAGEC